VWRVGIAARRVDFVDLSRVEFSLFRSGRIDDDGIEFERGNDNGSTFRNRQRSHR
jgi:hypothetical protein